MRLLDEILVEEERLAVDHSVQVDPTVLLTIFCTVDGSPRPKREGRVTIYTTALDGIHGTSITF